MLGLSLGSGVLYVWYLVCYKEGRAIENYCFWQVSWNLSVSCLTWDKMFHIFSLWKLNIMLWQLSQGFNENPVSLQGYQKVQGNLLYFGWLSLRLLVILLNVFLYRQVGFNTFIKNKNKIIENLQKAFRDL